VSIRSIAERVGIGERTVTRWLQAGRFPERRRRSERPGQVAPLRAYLRERWSQGCHHATLLWYELQTRGYTGCYGSVAALVTTWRGPRYRHRGQTKERAETTAAQDTYTPRQVCWLLLRPWDDLRADEQAYVTRLYQCCPQVAVAEALVEEFATVLREPDVAGLYSWLRGAEASGIKEMAALARGVRMDLAAVRLEWSNGQVEGKVNKLKMIKREHYGRAGFDLLRRFVLHAA
jgi:transposase